MSPETKTSNEVPMVEVNGQQVPNFVPQNETQAAIVSLNVIQRLASLIPEASLSAIKRHLIVGLEHTSNLEDYVKLLSNEVDFHRTINLITSYNREEILY